MTSAAAPVLVYLHGFLSSPASAKGRSLEAAALARGWGFRAPDLNRAPRECDRVIESLLADVAREGRAACLAGSSLGGFLALRAAGRRRIPCVAVNPCLDPWTHVPALTGEQRVFGTDRVLRVEASFADDFRALEAEAPAAPADPADALIVLSTADEVLDWRAAAGALSASPRILSVGDDHRMERFDACLEPVFAFLARRLRARDRAQ